MISHVFVAVNDFDAALRFYQPLMTSLGLAMRFCDPARPWAGWQSPNASRPLFLVGRPYDGRPASPGNGQMVALLAQDRQSIQLAYDCAMAHGGRSEGPPGLRPEYHASYYGAYFRDPEGNKLCVVCHTDVPAADGHR